MDHVGASLKRKLGPLPVWGWAIISGVVLYVVRNRAGGGGLLGSSSTSTDGTGSTGTLSSGAAGGGIGDNSALEQELSGLEQKVARQASIIKKLRAKLKKKKPHHKHHPKPKHHAGARTATKAASRIKSHVPMRAGSSRRDRTQIALKESGHVKQRGHVARAVTVGVSEPSHRAGARTGHAESSLGARTHFGGSGSASGRRHRPESPSAPGRNTRHRPLGGGADGSERDREAAPPPSRSSTRTPAPRHQPGTAKSGRKR